MEVVDSDAYLWERVLQLKHRSRSEILVTIFMKRCYHLGYKLTYAAYIAVMLGLNTFMRMVGSTLGLAVADALLKVGLERRLPLAIPPDYVSDILNSPETIHGSLPVEYIEAAKQAYADSLKDVWHVTTGFVGLGLSPIITRMMIFCIILT